MDQNEDAIKYQESDFRQDIKSKLLKTLVKESKKISESC